MKYQQPDVVTIRSSHLEDRQPTFDILADRFTRVVDCLRNHAAHDSRAKRARHNNDDTCGRAINPTASTAARCLLIDPGNHTRLQLIQNHLLRS